MADSIHAFTVTEHQKNPLEELIVSCIICALSEVSEKMIVSTFLKCIQNMTLTLAMYIYIYIHNVNTY